jgi:MFS family permease
MAHTSDAVVTRRGTSWMSVLGGWIASVGMAALLAPLAAGFVATRGGSADDISLAVPAVLAVLIAYLVGGYVAGRMAGYKTSWHGLMAAFFGLFVILAVILVGYLADNGYLGDVRLGAGDRASAWGFAPMTVGDALTFGAILGFLATIFAGWLGGLLAPDHLVAAPIVRPRTVEETTVVREPAREPARTRRGFRLLPIVGRKGGDHVERSERVDADGDREVRETRVERR